jgi:hypothetical protein
VNRTLDCRAAGATCPAGGRSERSRNMILYNLPDRLLNAIGENDPIA